MFPTAMLVRGLTWWWLQAVPLIPQTTMEYYTKNPQNLIFIALDFSNNFNSTAPFKNAILVPDLAGRPFGDDFEQLIPCQMSESYVPHSYVS